ncbi:MAG: T9SS type A sorting domain-containing protein [Bacteroidia bacterium]
MFVAKYDRTGNLEWAQSKGGTGSDEANGISTDRGGHFYLTGSFQDSLKLNGVITLVSGGGSDIFIAKKFSQDGQAVWADNPSGLGENFGKGIYCNASGQIALSGYFGSPTLLVGATLLTKNGSPSSANTDLFVAVYDSSGQVLWANRAGGTGGESGNGVVVNKEGVVFMTGSSTSQNFIAGPYSFPVTGGIDGLVARIDPGPSGIEINNREFRLYPNPTTGRLFVDVPVSCQRIVVLNSLGQVVQNHQVAGQNHVELELGEKGLYVVSFLLENKSFSRKVIVL